MGAHRYTGLATLETYLQLKRDKVHDGKTGPSAVAPSHQLLSKPRDVQSPHSAERRLQESLVGWEGGREGEGGDGVARYWTQSSSSPSPRPPPGDLSGRVCQSWTAEGRRKIRRREIW